MRCEVTYTEGRQLEPNDEDSLEGKVPRKIVQDESEGETLQKVEETKNNPVSKPLNIVKWRG